MTILFKKKLWHEWNQFLLLVFKKWGNKKMLLDLLKFCIEMCKKLLLIIGYCLFLGLLIINICFKAV